MRSVPTVILSRLKANGKHKQWLFLTGNVILTRGLIGHGLVSLRFSPGRVGNTYLQEGFWIVLEDCKLKHPLRSQAEAEVAGDFLYWEH